MTGFLKAATAATGCYKKTFFGLAQNIPNPIKFSVKQNNIIYYM